MAPWSGKPSSAGVRSGPRFGRDLIRRFLIIEVLGPVHPDQFEEIRDRQRSDYQAEQSEVLNSGEGADDGDKGMDPGPAPKDHGTNHVVDIPDDYYAPECKTNGSAVVPLQCKG